MTTILHLPPISQINSNLKLTQTPTRKSIITCAKTKGVFGSPQSRKTLIQFVRFAASNLHHVLPPPYNAIIQQLSGGSGNGGAGNGTIRFSGGGGGGGWRRRGSKKAQFWVMGLGFVIVLGLGFLGLRGELGVNNDVVVIGGMCLGMLLVLIRSGFVPEWLLGFFGGAVVAGGLLFKKDEMRKFLNSFKAVGSLRRRRSGRRGYKF